MKRKVKFQEGGAVEEPARRPAPRSRISRMSEAARNRQAEARAAAQREVERLNALRDVEDFNRRVQRGTVNAETMRRMGATPLPPGTQDFTTSSEGVTRRGTATGREVVPFQEPGAPARPSAGRALGEVATPRQIPIGSPRPRVGGNIATMGGALALEAAGPLADYGRRFMDRRAAEIAAANAERAQAARNRELDAMQAALPAGPDVEAERAARGAAPGRRPVELGAGPAASMARLRREQRQPEMSEADILNQRELERILAERAVEERAFKKGGMVKAKAKPVAKKAGGMIGKPKAAPKKMMKGGVVAKPKSKAKPAAKPMPFKKGGVIKKGRK